MSSHRPRPHEQIDDSKDRKEHNPAKRRRSEQHKTPRRERLDPVVFLNEHVLDEIISQLSCADLVRCERVSRTWQSFLHYWIGASGVHYIFRHLWDPARAHPLEKLPAPAVLRQNLRVLHHIQAGKLVSAHRFERVRLFCTAGNLAAWVPKRKLKSPGEEGVEEDSISYLAVRKGEREADATVETVYVSRFLHSPFAREREGVRIMQVNANGLILLVLETRSVVWSPVEDKVVWSLETGSNDGIRHVPILIGQSTVYAAASDRDSYGRRSWRLESYSIQTGQQLYHSAASIHSWIDGVLYGIYNKEVHAYAKLVRDSSGQELIFQILQWSRYEEPGIAVIRGADGHKLQTIRVRVDRISQVIFHSPRKQMAIVEEMVIDSFLDNLDRDQQAILRDYRIFLVHRLLYNDEDTSFSEAYEDVVFIPRLVELNPTSSENLAAAVDVFHMTALVASEQRQTKRTARGVALSRCPLVTTDDPAFRNAAEAVRAVRVRAARAVRALSAVRLPGCHVSIRQCYVLGEEVMLSVLPADKDEAQDTMEQPLLPARMRSFETHFLENGNLMLGRNSRRNGFGKDYLLLNWT
ncbi:hypothetical protein BJX61DRAFT_542238 [Aspergillus egyptiacus]|nr:hypothetical protein BJX61DRAFT_542238 [Aspergillus egyptiacus]